MASLKSFLNKLSLGNVNLKVGGFSINLPTLNITNKSIEGIGIGGYITSGSSALQILTRGARGVFCIGALLTNPAQGLKMLNLCKNYLLAHGLTFVNDIYKTALSRVNLILATNYGQVLGWFKSSQNLITAIKGTKDTISNIHDSIVGNGKNGAKKLFERENCEFEIANLVKCMTGPMISSFTSSGKTIANNALSDLLIGKVQNPIVNHTESINALSAYFDKQANSLKALEAKSKNLF